MIVTGYENYSQNQLHALFSTEKWSQLSFENRIKACQEVENRYASEFGVTPCSVIVKQMDGAAYGWQKGNTICLNTFLIRDGLFRVEYQGSSGQSVQAEVSALAPGWNMLDTIYHEGTHGIQEAKGLTPTTYISPQTDRDFYRIQIIEKEAYAVGQSRTLDALLEWEHNTGKLDPSRQEYIDCVKNDSYRNAVYDAAQHYRDPYIEKTLNSVVENRDQNHIPESPSASYLAINTLCEGQVFYAAEPDNSFSEKLNSVYESETTSYSAFDGGMDTDETISTAGDGIERKEEFSYLDDGVNIDMKVASFEDGIQSFSLSESHYDGISSYSAGLEIS